MFAYAEMQYHGAMNDYHQFAHDHAYGAILDPAERAQRRDPAAQLDQAAMERLFGRVMARPLGTARYAYAIPDDTALDILAELAPLIEIGAGTGYWAHLLRQRGVNILAFDEEPPLTDDHTNTFHRNEVMVGTVWTEVLVGGPEQAARHPERTLFLCWPPAGPLASDALTTYEGTSVVYIGEWMPATCADVAFFDMLERDWACVRVYEIPRWFGMKDRMSVWRRHVLR